MVVTVHTATVAHVDGQRCCTAALSQCCHVTCYTTVTVHTATVAHVDGQRCCTAALSQCCYVTCYTTVTVHTATVAHVDGRQCCTAALSQCCYVTCYTILTTCHRASHSNSCTTYNCYSQNHWLLMPDAYAQSIITCNEYSGNVSRTADHRRKCCNATVCVGRHCK